MKGLHLFIFTGVIWIFTLLVCLAVGLNVGIEYFFIGAPNWKILYAALSALLAMLVLGTLFLIDINQSWLNIPRGLYDTFGWIWACLPVIIAIVVYVKAPT